jgi:hypothetical protein
MRFSLRSASSKPTSKSSLVEAEVAPRHPVAMQRPDRWAFTHEVGYAIDERR